MANIAKRADGHRRARYRDAHGKERARHFNRKIDAQNWLDSVTTAMQTGVYVDPNRGKITIEDWSARWLDGQAHLKPSTHERYAGILREHVLPQRSAVQLIDVTHADVQAPVSGLAGRRRCARFIASFHSSSRRPSGTVDWRGIRQRRSTCRGSSPPSADSSRTSRCMHWPRRWRNLRKSVSTAASTSARIGPTD